MYSDGSEVMKTIIETHVSIARERAKPYDSHDILQTQGGQDVETEDCSYVQSNHHFTMYQGLSHRTALVTCIRHVWHA